MLATTGRAKSQANRGGRAMTNPTNTTNTTGEAELLRLSAELDRLWDAEKAIAELEEKTDADFREARDRTCQVVEKIAAIPATTLAGLRVKAKAVTWMETDDYKPSAMNNFEWSLHQEVVAGVLALVNVD